MTILKSGTIGQKNDQKKSNVKSEHGKFVQGLTEACHLNNKRNEELVTWKKRKVNERRKLERRKSVKIIYKEELLKTGNFEWRRKELI